MTTDFGHRFGLDDVGQKCSEPLLGHRAQVEDKFWSDIVEAGLTLFKASSNSVSVKGEGLWTGLDSQK